MTELFSEEGLFNRITELRIELELLESIWEEEFGGN